MKIFQFVNHEDKTAPVKKFFDKNYKGDKKTLSKINNILRSTSDNGGKIDGQYFKPLGRGCGLYEFRINETGTSTKTLRINATKDEQGIILLNAYVKPQKRNKKAPKLVKRGIKEGKMYYNDLLSGHGRIQQFNLYEI